MKKEKPAILKEISLREYILVFKYFMKKTKCKHVTGFVNAPLLCANPDQAELEQLVNSATKHGVLVHDGQNITINGNIFTFINAWIHSRNVIAIKKPSFSDQKGIFVAGVEGMYLATIQDAFKDKIVLIADSDLENLYEYLKGEIEKKGYKQTV